MQINKQELDMQLVELLPERETLFFNRTVQANFANVGTAQVAIAGGLVNLGDVTAANISGVVVGQSNTN